MNPEDIDQIIRRVREAVSQFREPVVSEIARKKRDPYHVLISCLLSLRTKDKVTRETSKRLFELADNPADMTKLSHKTIEKAIYPVGFYHTKARNIIEISRELVVNHSSRVPNTVEELIQFKGVGRKTANLVVTLGYGKPGICVDTHVHRISNRLGYVKTKTPEQTEMALRGKLPHKYWIKYNDLLVSFGQNVCNPISPFCSRCSVAELCDRVGVTRHR